MQTTLNKIKLRESLRLTFNYNHLFTYYNFDSKWNNSWIVKPYRKRIRYSRKNHCKERFKNNFLKRLCFSKRDTAGDSVVLNLYTALHCDRYRCRVNLYRKMFLFPMMSLWLWKGQPVNLVTCGLRYLLFTSKYLQSDFQILNLYLLTRSSNFSEEYFCSQSTRYLQIY